MAKAFHVHGRALRPRVEPVFKQDHVGDFENEWWQCKRDRYVIIREGSEETGFCPTKLGRERCYDVVYGRPPERR